MVGSLYGTGTSVHDCRERPLPTLRAQLEAHPDATFAEHLVLWNTQHPAVSQSALVRAIKRTHWTRKKRRCMPENKIQSPDRRFESV